MDQLTDSSVLSHAHSAGLGLQIDIESVIQNIKHEFIASKNFLFSRTIPLPQLDSFAVDLALVGLFIRTGHLVDAFCPKDPCRGFSALLHRLKQKSKLFQNVVHVYEPCSEQSFLINISLLVAKYSKEIPVNKFADWPFAFPVFVSTSSPPEILSSPPEGLFTLLQNLIDQLLNPSHTLRETSTIILPQGLSPSLTVPLAAILLEYPVAYCPSMAVVSPFLSSVTLDVYEVRLIFLENEGDVTSTRREAWPSVNNEERQHRSVLKFSCPSSLTHSYAGLSYQSMKERLQSCFEHRLVNVWPGGTPIISVHHTIESVDRVTL